MAGTPANSMNLNATIAGIVNWDGVNVMSVTPLTQYSTLAAGSNKTIAQIAPGTAGYVLTSNGPGAFPTYQAAAAGGITGITGDTGGTTTGTTVTFNGTTNSGTTVNFTRATNTLSLKVTDGTKFNTYVGLSCGNSGAGTINTAFGYGNMASSMSGTYNNAFGVNSMPAITSGGYNCSYGPGVNTLSTASYNSIYGVNSYSNGNANANTVVGAYCLTNVTSGVGNVVIGSLNSQTTGSGWNYTGAESYNILIGNAGTLGESNVLRIGTKTGTGAFQLNAAYIQGIAGVTVANSATVLIDTTTGQLGTVASSRRYKNNIADIDNNRVLSLRPVSFNYNNGPDETEIQYGLIAEEVLEHMPELVVFKDGQPETVQYHKLTALLLKEIQRLSKRIDLLESK